MRLDQKLGSELAAQLSGSLGAVAAWERKVELLLRNCWLPPVVATLVAAMEKTAAMLRAEEGKRQAEVAVQRAVRGLSEQHAAAAAAARSAELLQARASSKQGDTPSADKGKVVTQRGGHDGEMEELDAFDAGEPGADAAVDATEVVPVPDGRPGRGEEGAPILLQEVGGTKGESWLVKGRRHWSLAELRAAALPAVGRPFLFLAPVDAPAAVEGLVEGGVPLCVQMDDEATVPLSALAAPVLVHLVPLDEVDTGGAEAESQSQWIGSTALADNVAGRLALSMLSSRVPPQPEWGAPAVTNRSH